MHIHHRAAATAATLAVAALASGCGSATVGDEQLPAAAAAPARPVTIVPNIIGVEQGRAHRLLDRAGLRMRWTGFAGELANGHYVVSCAKVLRQSPAGGERRPKGTMVAVIEEACKPPGGTVHVAH